MQIRLTHPHEHAGRACAPGDVLDLADDAALWLISAGRAEVSVSLFDVAPALVPLKPIPAPRRAATKGK